jgi:hypothetical protein
MMDLNTQAQTFFKERRKSASLKDGPIWIAFLAVVTLLMAAGLAIFAGHLIPAKFLYKPGDDVGYNLGLTGGLMMLVMLLYPLRKRARFLRNWGILPIWFRWHMVLGILGPAIVVFHSTFTIHSLNAGVALTCMMLVSGSGIFGRFFYTKIHNGLYGRQITLQSMKEEMAKTGSYNRAIAIFASDIGAEIAAFYRRVGALKGGFGEFLQIGMEASQLSKKLVRDLRKTMYEQAREHQWDNGSAKKNLDALFEEYAHYIRLSIKVARDTAQFHTYERLFSWWHIFHIPLVYMLAFSGIYHVIAVHMY